MSADKITVILGPTASGKTDCAIALAEKMGGVVLSADSRQVYAGMNIGTAKPADAWSDTAHDELISDPVNSRPALGDANTIPHYLLNIRTPDNPLTLPQWQRAALAVLEHTNSKKTPSVVAGGTMLYIDSILYNYAIPEVPPNEELREMLMKRPADELYEELTAHDPAARQFIEPHHKQRIIRALEVIRATGEPFSRLRQQRPSQYTFTVLGIFPGWKELKERITARTKRMFAEGLLEETEKLIRAYGATLPLLQTMGYKEASSVLAGDMSADEAQNAFCQAQLRYARRQMSWWKKRPEIRWIGSVSDLSTF